VKAAANGKKPEMNRKLHLYILFLESCLANFENGPETRRSQLYAASFGETRALRHRRSQQNKQLENATATAKVSSSQ